MLPRNSLLFAVLLSLLVGGCGVTITETSRTSGEGGAAALLELFDLPSLIDIVSAIAPPEKGEHETGVILNERFSSDGKKRSFLSVREKTEASW